jgi:hypothetical protein
MYLLSRRRLAPMLSELRLLFDTRWTRHVMLGARLPARQPIMLVRHDGRCADRAVPPRYSYYWTGTAYSVQSE